MSAPFFGRASVKRAAIDRPRVERESPDRGDTGDDEADKQIKPQRNHAVTAFGREREKDGSFVFEKQKRAPPPPPLVNSAFQQMEGSAVFFVFTEGPALSSLVMDGPRGHSPIQCKVAREHSVAMCLHCRSAFSLSLSLQSLSLFFVGPSLRPLSRPGRGLQLLLHWPRYDTKAAASLLLGSLPGGKKNRKNFSFCRNKSVRIRHGVPSASLLSYVLFNNAAVVNWPSGQVRRSFFAPARPAECKEGFLSARHLIEG